MNEEASRAGQEGGSRGDHPRHDRRVNTRVLNADKALTIRNETRERVLTAVRRLNYRPNIIARSLELRASYALGTLLPDIANPMFPDIIPHPNGGTPS